MSNSPILAIDAGTLYTPQDKISPATILIQGKSIVGFGLPQQIPVPPGTERIDARAFMVTPGFIEPHIHGCGGVDIMDGTFESLNTVSRTVASHGTTSFLATTVSSPPVALTGVLERLSGLKSRNFAGAQLLGVHLEGPFISHKNRGTHKDSNIITPDPKLFRDWIAASASTIRLITVAPEVNGNNEIVQIAAEHGICVGMGHSNATWEEATAAAENGVCYAVHTFNAMRPFLHRDPGIVGAVLCDDRIFAEIIADGIHVHPAAIRFFARSKGRQHILLVTDSISATDMSDGDYVLGSDRIKVLNGICRDSEGRLAGSTLTQEVALKNFVEWSEVSIQDALYALTENPAKVLGLHDKGVIRLGADADLTVMDANFRVMKTFVAGKLVFAR